MKLLMALRYKEQGIADLSDEQGTLAQCTLFIPAS